MQLKESKQSTTHDYMKVDLILNNWALKGCTFYSGKTVSNPLIDSKLDRRFSDLQINNLNIESSTFTIPFVNATSISKLDNSIF